MNKDQVPLDWYGNDVPVKKNPDEGYSPEFIEARKKKLEQLKALLKER